MPKAFHAEQTVTVDDEVFRLVINFRALDAIEGLLDCSFDEVLGELNGGRPRLGLVGKVLWGLLREHHSELTLDQIATLMFGESGVTMGAAVQSLLEAAFPAAEPAKEKVENPPKRRGASSPS